MKSHLLACAALLATPATAATDAEWQAKTRAMFEHVVNIPTVEGRDRVPEMAQYLADQFRAAGWVDADVRVMPHDKTAALIVRWPAQVRSGARSAPQKGIMLMGHMDVVEAKREDSTTDPFVLTERDGYLYGRGTIDMKDGIVGITQALIKLRSEGFKPKRDIVVFFSGDEETTGKSAILGATEWKDVIGPLEYGLNADAGGGGFLADGKPLGFGLQAAEKTYADFTLTVRNRGGHSSKPRADNAIYQLAAALKRLEAHRFEPVFNEVTRGYFTARAKTETGPLGDAMRAWLANPADAKAADFIEADETEAGLTRTRCVATQLFGGHAPNALPQLATANVNCRIMPGVAPAAIEAEIERVIADAQISVEPVAPSQRSDPSPLRPDVVAAYTRAVHARHPGVPIIPEMSAGATDARPFRSSGIPVYGVNGAWVRVPDDLRAHGKDERIPVKALHDNVAHWEQMVRELAGK